MITSLLTYNDMMDHCFMFHLHIYIYHLEIQTTSEPTNLRQKDSSKQVGRANEPDTFPLWSLHPHYVVLIIFHFPISTKVIYIEGRKFFSIFYSALCNLSDFL